MFQTMENEKTVKWLSCNCIRSSCLRVACLWMCVVALSWGASANYDHLDATEKAQIYAAYQNPLYDNVGKLEYRGTSKTVCGRGSVVYLGGRTCLTAAHCIVDLESCTRVVSFENGDGKFIDYAIESIVVHPDYKKNG